MWRSNAPKRLSLRAMASKRAKTAFTSRCGVGTTQTSIRSEMWHPNATHRLSLSCGVGTPQTSIQSEMWYPNATNRLSLSCGIRLRYSRSRASIGWVRRECRPTVELSRAPARATSLDRESDSQKTCDLEAPAGASAAARCWPARFAAASNERSAASIRISCFPMPSVVV